MSGAGRGRPVEGVDRGTATQGAAGGDVAAVARHARGAGSADRAARLAEIVGLVVRQALSDRGAGAVALIDDGGPEAELAAGWLERALPDGAVHRVTAAHAALESLLQPAGGGAEAARARSEALRFAARLVPGAIVANPVNRTVVLLSGDPPPDPLLPLADLYASEVAELTGAWSGPDAVREIAERAGGVAALDAALRARLEGRDRDGLRSLPAGLAAEVDALLARGRAARRAAWIVPKIGYRTLGVDLFE